MGETWGWWIWATHERDRFTDTEMGTESTSTESFGLLGCEGAQFFEERLGFACWTGPLLPSGLHQVDFCAGRTWPMKRGPVELRKLCFLSFLI
jgi:hypothetical protein